METLGRVNRDKIHDLLVKLENSELRSTDIIGYHKFVKNARATAGQSVTILYFYSFLFCDLCLLQNLPQAKYMTPAELQAFLDAEKEAEKLQKLQQQRQQQQQHQYSMMSAASAAPPPPPPSAVPPPPPLGKVGAKKPAAPVVKEAPAAPTTPEKYVEVMEAKECLTYSTEKRKQFRWRQEA